MKISMTVLGGICILYYLLLLFVRMDFSIVWLIAGLTLLCGGRWGNLLPKGLKIVAFVLAAVGFLVFVTVEVLIIKEMSAKEPENPSYLIVLGAQVRGDIPSRALRKRLEKAAEFLHNNPETVAVLSGGQGPGENITEAEAMFQYLVKAGIGEERMLLEERSTSTMENLEFSGELIGELTVPVGILSNNFHVFRALQLAKKQGYTQVSGIAASSDPVFQIHYLVREFFALLKEKIKRNI